MRTALIFLTSVLASAQMTAPRLGFIADPKGAVRPVFGLPGNLWLGDPFSGSVVSIASSGSITLAKTDQAVLVLDAQGQILSKLVTDAGPALFAFSSASPALAYLPSTNALFAWRTDHFEPSVPLGDALGGDAESLAAVTPGVATFLVRRPGGLWRIDLSMSDATIVGQTALNLSSPALITSDGALIYALDTSLYIRDASGAERQVDLGFAPSALSQMGSGWLHVRQKDSSLQFAVRISAGREQTWQLPEAQ